MTLPGPIQVTPVSSVTGQEIGLRTFQRVTAQVLSVTGTTAVLSIEGHEVVAQLASSEQAATLLSQRTAQFIVTELAGQGFNLKLVKNDAPQPATPQPAAPGQELAARILGQNNIPLNDSNLMLARALLRQHLPITPRLLTDLSEALAGYGAWGEGEAELAAAMRTAGLPVTAESLKLASRQVTQSGAAVTDLIATLTQASRQDLPADLLRQIDQALQSIRELILRGEGQASELADQLKQAVKLTGRSLENLLMDQPAGAQSLPAGKSLAALVHLEQRLEQAGQKEAARAVNEFLAGVRQNQLLNVKPDPIPGRGAWTEIGFLIQNPPQTRDLVQARVKVARQAQEDEDRINPAYTRLIIQVDLDSGKTVEVDLSLVGKQVRTSVTAPDAAWYEGAQSELPSLEESLSQLGYIVKDMQVGVGDPQRFEGFKTVKAGIPPLMNVNIEA